MSWRDDLNYAKNIFKTGTPKEKWEYFWDYYKWHTIVLVLAIGFLGNVIYSNVTAKDYVLQGFFFNTQGNEEAGTALGNDFLEAFPINSDKEDIFFATNYFLSVTDDAETLYNSYEVLQLITAKLAAKEIDFMVSDLATMNFLAYREFAAELSEILTAEQMEQYEPYFLYFDRAFMEKLNDTDTAVEIYINKITHKNSRAAPCPHLIKSWR